MLSFKGKLRQLSLILTDLSRLGSDGTSPLGTNVVLKFLRLQAGNATAHLHVLQTFDRKKVMIGHPR